MIKWLDFVKKLIWWLEIVHSYKIWQSLCWNQQYMLIREKFMYLEGKISKKKIQIQFKFMTLKKIFELSVRLQCQLLQVGYHVFTFKKRIYFCFSERHWKKLFLMILKRLLLMVLAWDVLTSYPSNLLRKETLYTC